MIHLPPVLELSFIGVEEPGVPGRERLVFRPSEPVNLGRFGILLGFVNPDGSKHLLTDHFFWFGVGEVAPPSWIIVFTAEGEDFCGDWKGQKVHTFHWGKKHTLFHRNDVLPILFKNAAILTGGLNAPPQSKQITQ
jgi:hypothetical protein